jgi:hypothetical protein
MLSDVVSAVVLAGLVLAAWLLPKYLERRVTAAAQGAVDERVGKVLADHRHDLDKQLEVHRSALSRELEEFRQSLGLRAHRFTQDYALFASRRNQVYAEVYALLEKARGMFSPYFSVIRMGPDFSRAGALDLMGFAKTKEHLAERERAELGELAENDIGRARELAAELQEKIGLRAAHVAFRDYKNACVLEALYLGPEVDALVNQSIANLAALASRSIDLEHLERVDYNERAGLLRALESTTGALRSAMRTEMQAGFASAATDAAPPPTPGPPTPSAGPRTA